MDSRNRILAVVMAVILVGQGVAPGVVLCRGDEGHVALETTFDRCCSEPARIPFGASVPALQSGEGGAGDCGRCADTFIVKDPCRVTTQGHADAVGLSLASDVVLNDDVPDEPSACGDPSIVFCLALIPVKTSILRI